VSGKNATLLLPLNETFSRRVKTI